MDEEGLDTEFFQATNHECDAKIGKESIWDYKNDSISAH